MEVYRQEAVPLCLKAVHGIPNFPTEEITHLIVTSCTGFYAPGVDIDLVKDLDFHHASKEHSLFHGLLCCCNRLRQAREIIQADPNATVLMVNVELCSLHLQETTALDRLVSFLLFADGAAASIISSKPVGLRLDDCYSHLSLANADRMGWVIEDQGFAMSLDVRVPILIKKFITQNPEAVGSAGLKPDPSKLLGRSSGRQEHRRRSAGSLPHSTIPKWKSVGEFCEISATCLPPHSCSRCEKFYLKRTISSAQATP